MLENCKCLFYCGCGCVQITSSLFEDGKVGTEKYGRQLLGVFRMGGVGKITLYVAMCTHFQEEFRDGVCHVEFRSDRVEERPTRFKHVVEQLAGFHNSIRVMIITSEAHVSPRLLGSK